MKKVLKKKKNQKYYYKMIANTFFLLSKPAKQLAYLYIKKTTIFKLFILLLNLKKTYIAKYIISNI